MLSLAHCTKCLKTLAKVMPDCSYRAGRKILILCMYFMISIESVKIPAFGNSTLDERYNLFLLSFHRFWVPPIFSSKHFALTPIGRVTYFQIEIFEKNVHANKFFNSGPTPASFVVFLSIRV